MGASSNKRKNESKISDSIFEDVDPYFGKVSKSICKIKYKKESSSGLLLKYSFEQKQFYCLITCQHVIRKEDMIDKQENIYVYYDNEFEKFNIKLNPKERYIKTFTDIDKDLDITIVQILPEDKIEKVYFLAAEFNYIDKNDLKNSQIYIPQFPSGKKLKNSRGIIKDIIDNEIIHLASTEGGSSGSPIFLEESIKLIGIHKQGAGEENIGVLIYPILNILNNDLVNIDLEKTTLIKVINNNESKVNKDIKNNYENDNNNFQQSIIKASKSICKIIYLNETFYGFLIKFLKEEEDFFCLMTNANNINQEMIKENQSINFYYDNGNKNKKINLNEKERYIKYFKDINMDVIIIEILPIDSINKDYFLSPIADYPNILNKDILIIKNVFEGKLTHSIVNIKEMENNKFIHTENISSGNPIFIKDSIKIIGIQSGNNNNDNYGYFIESIYFYFKNGMKFKIINNKEDGGYYFGKIKNGLKHGKGILYYKNGNIAYEGDWINDKTEGEGKFISEEGEYYIGQWKNGFRNGKGILYYKNGNICYDGYWINEKAEGEGKFIDENGKYYEGQWKNGFKHGKGKIYYKNGNIEYEGDFINDKYEGNGKYTLEDGESYIGQWKNGLRNGKGIEYYKNGNLLYEGDWINDKFEGEGKIIDKDGEYYIGQWKNGVKQGKGKIYYKNGNIKYEGDLYNDKANGDGTIIFENGDYYIGQFKNGLKHGKGIEFYKNGNIKYEGDYINDKFEGNGKCIFEDADGEYYIGQWKNGLRNGKGIQYYKNGNVLYDGDWINHMPEGKGKFILENGEYYIGQFKNGLKNGKGTHYKKNGNIVYEGDWTNNNPDGEGKIIFENGEYYIGEFKNGVRNGKGILYNKNCNMVYEGDWTNNNPDGEGKLICENGEYYIGQFKNGLKNGNGIEFYKTGIIKNEGNFINNKYKGKI